jgi:hypothetical protein
MIINKLAISRRTVLRGMGATIALPLLDSMVPALTALQKTSAAPVRRFSVIYVAHGAAPGFWVPSTEGASYELSPILQPLAKFQDRMMVLTGIENPPAFIRDGEPRGGHGRIAPAFMTGVHVKPTIGGDFEAGVSIDQIAAKQIGQDTQLPSLELSVDSAEFSGTCDTGYACVYTNTLCWAGPTSPLPMENNPRATFERLFGDSGTTNSDMRQARIREKRSILDSVLSKASRLGQAIGATDRTRLTQYLDSIREVERQIQRAEEQAENELPEMHRPSGIPATFEEHVKLMFDLQVLAFQADLTRVSTFMLAKELNGRSYPQIGVPEGHHSLSHHQDLPEKLSALAKINAYHAGLLGSFLERLEATQDGPGTLMDHSLVLYGSGMGNANQHDPHELPLIVTGGGSGMVKGKGKHLRYSEGTRLTNLHVTLLDKLGVPIEKLGDSSGQLPIDGLSGV